MAGRAGRRGLDPVGTVIIAGWDDVSCFLLCHLLQLVVPCTTADCIQASYGALPIQLCICLSVVCQRQLLSLTPYLAFVECFSLLRSFLVSLCMAYAHWQPTHRNLYAYIEKASNICMSITLASGTRQLPTWHHMHLLSILAI